MTQDDKSREYLTPSEWHDDASRDAGHDEMQALLFRSYRDRPPGWTIEERVDSKLIELRKVGEWVEFPLVAQGRIIGFVDLALAFEPVDPNVRITKRTDGTWPVTTWFYRFYELKPKIGSVGAVLRQCEAIQQQAIRAGYEHFRVIPVVYQEDPKRDLLGELSSFLVVATHKPRRCEPDSTP